MAGQFADNPNYLEYERLLLKLHDMITRGQGDTDDADAVRDAMDAPERHLSPVEIARLDGLSADLYMLQDEEIFEEATPEERTPEGLAVALQEAERIGDWERVLALLRRGGDTMTRDRLAAFRTQAYAKLGHGDVSLLFARHGAELAPHNGDSSRESRSRTEPSLERMRRAAELFKLVSDPIRSQVILMLINGERHIEDLCAQLNQSPSVFRRHLTMLRIGGVISPCRQGKNTVYGLTETGVKFAASIELAASVEDLIGAESSARSKSQSDAQLINLMDD